MTSGRSHPRSDPKPDSRFAVCAVLHDKPRGIFVTMMAPRKKSTTHKKKSARKYGKKAGEKVRRSMEEMKAGKLRSGRSGKKVTSRKQAIAIGLSEARREGDKVPKKKS